MIVYQQDADGWRKIYENEYGIREIDIGDDGSAWFYTLEALYSWDGHFWNRLSSFDDIVGSRERVTVFDAYDSAHVWLISETSKQLESEGNDEWYEVSKIYFYDGASWSMQFEIEGDACLFLLDPDHAWCWSGKDIYFYDGESWTKQFTADCDIKVVGAGISGCAWAIGNNDESQKLNTSKAYFFNGLEWEDKGEIDQKINTIEIVDDDLAWAWLAAGEGQYSDRNEVWSDIYRWNGDSWERSLDENQDLVSFRVLGPDLAWAAFHEKVYSYQKGKWKQQLEGKTISSLVATDDQNVWCIIEAPDSLGDIIYYDGTSWEEVSDINGNCTDILALDNSHVWVVSHPSDSINENGYLIEKPDTFIYYFNGAEWNKQFEICSRIHGLRGEDIEIIWGYGGDMVYMSERE